MSITALSTTTLTPAIDNSQRRFVLGSTTGINGVGSLTAPQSIIVIGGEPMLVMNVPVAGTVEVMRGHGGRAVPHAAGATVYFGSKERFIANVDGSIGLAGDPGSLMDYRLPLSIAREDPNTGFEYRMVSFSEAMAIGEWVVISGAGVASALAATSKGRVGIVVETIGGSGVWGWVLVAGTYAAARTTSTVTSATRLIAGAKIVDAYVPSAGGTIVFGAVATGAASGTSSLVATDEVAPVYINHPWVDGLAAFWLSASAPA